jgi:3-oxoacyl-[acyl-carrier-protein] synthase III
MSRSNAFRILGTGIGVPETVVTNADIRDRWNADLDCAWVADRLGIRERRIAGSNVRSSDLAAIAVSAALTQADIAKDSVDLLIVATATPDRKAPSTACLTQAKAGLPNAAAFDLSAVCCGFLYALTTASAYLRAGHAKRAVVVGADTFSRITDWGRRDCVFFGDGAGAVVVERSPVRAALFDAELYSDGTKAELFTVRPGCATFSMDARGVFTAAAHAVPKCVARLLTRNKIGGDEITMVVPHQPSIGLLRRLAEELGMPFTKFRTNMDRYANTGGATIPIVLHETYENGRLKNDDLVMFAAAGAGFTAGAALYRWH